MTGFKGFTDDRNLSVPIPVEFFAQVLPALKDTEEIKAILCVLRLLSGRSGQVKYFFLDDLLEDEVVKDCFAGEEAIDLALDKACNDRLLLHAEYEGRKLYFLSTPHSSAALRAMQKKAWRPDTRTTGLVPGEERKNSFSLYEKNIGPLTPIIAETLEDAEKEYPSEWIEEAIAIAVKKNVRNWQYVEAILRSWKEKGRSEKDRRDNKENSRRYIEGDLADYIKH